jgi:hypothetical protein
MIIMKKEVNGRNNSGNLLMKMKNGNTNANRFQYS